MPATQPPPGLTHQSTVRTTARVLSVVLIGLGIVLGVKGLSSFFEAANSMSMDSSGDFGTFLMIGGGGLCVVLGFAAIQTGWMGAGARYAAGETMPVVKDSVGYLTNGPAGATGPFCRGCGTRNDETATFCDHCGQSLA